MKTITKIIEQLKREAKRYKNYYDILRLDRDNIDDEMVLNAYEQEYRKIEKFFSGNMPDELLEVKELMLLSLNDAYTALKTEHSRKNYQQALDIIENKKQNIEQEGTDR